MQEENLVSVDTILNYFKCAIEQRIPLPPADYLDSAAKLNVLLEEIDEAWILARMELNKKKVGLIESGMRVAQAQVFVEATGEWAEMMRIIAKRERVRQFIMLAKKRSELREWE